MTKNSVTINGNVYDAESGSILSARPSGRSPAAAASDFHNSTQKSRTLQRKYINKPRVIDSVASTSRSTQPRQLTVAERTPRIIHHSERVRAAQDVQRSTSITRFAKEPPVKHPDVADTPDIAPTTNHLEQVARQRQALCCHRKSSSSRLSEKPLPKWCHANNAKKLSQRETPYFGNDWSVLAALR